MSLVCVDKRNGRIAYKKDFANHAGVLDISGDPEKKTVDLVLQQETIRLTFTDKPLPPSSAAEFEPAKLPPGSKSVRALWKSMQKVLGGPLGESDEDEGG